jgi:hypothetical protein
MPINIGGAIVCSEGVMTINGDRDKLHRLKARREVVLRAISALEKLGAAYGRKVGSPCNNRLCARKDPTVSKTFASESAKTLRSSRVV